MTGRDRLRIVNELLDTPRLINACLDGRRAMRRGVTRDKNPHEPGTDLYEAWAYGFSDEKAENS